MPTNREVDGQAQRVQARQYSRYQSWHIETRHRSDGHNPSFVDVRYRSETIERAPARPSTPDPTRGGHTRRDGSTDNRRPSNNMHPSAAQGYHPQDTLATPRGSGPMQNGDRLDAARTQDIMNRAPHGADLGVRLMAAAKNHGRYNDHRPHDEAALDDFFAAVHEEWRSVHMYDTHNHHILSECECLVASWTFGAEGGGGQPAQGHRRPPRR